jgi:hypothetical protein
MLSKKREIPMDSAMFQPVTGNRAATLDATSAQTGALRREIEAAGPYVSLKWLDIRREDVAAHADPDNPADEGRVSEPPRCYLAYRIGR